MSNRATTAKELATNFIGRTGTIGIWNAGEELRFPVKCVDARKCWDHIDVRLEPAKEGTGAIWRAASVIMWD